MIFTRKLLAGFARKLTGTGNELSVGLADGPSAAEEAGLVVIIAATATLDYGIKLHPG